MGGDQIGYRRPRVGIRIIDALLERVGVVIPELIELIGQESSVLDLSFETEREDRVLVYG